MKAHSLLFYLLCLSVLACKKDNDSVDSDKTSDKCDLVRIDNHNASGTPANFYLLQYDSIKRLSTIVSDDKSSQSSKYAHYTARLNYQGNIIFASVYDTSGGIQETDTIVLDAQQHLVSYINTVLNRRNVTTFRYDANGYLSESHELVGSTIYDRYYKWANGDVISDSTAPNAVTRSPFGAKYEYYTDKPAPKFITLQNEQLNLFLHHGVTFYKTAHLLKSISYTDGTVYYYSYTVDAGNKIIAVTVSDGLNSGVTNYSYDCK